MAQMSMCVKMCQFYSLIFRFLSYPMLYFVSLDAIAQHFSFGKDSLVYLRLCESG